MEVNNETIKVKNLAAYNFKCIWVDIDINQGVHCTSITKKYEIFSSLLYTGCRQT